MIGIHPSIMFDLVGIAQREQLEKYRRASMMAEANRNRAPRTGFFRSMRRVIGAGIIGLGHWVRGERPEGLELSESAGAGSIRMAR